MENYTKRTANRYGIIKHYNAKEELHRLDGPAVDLLDGMCGTKEWFIDGKRHRKDGPAVIWADGDKIWFLNDRRHRLDGPAVEYNDMIVWCLLGVEYSKSCHNRLYLFFALEPSRMELNPTEV